MGYDESNGTSFTSANKRQIIAVDAGIRAIEYATSASLNLATTKLEARTSSTPHSLAVIWLGDGFGAVGGSLSLPSRRYL